MEPKVYNLEDLAEAVGMKPRTIRSYIQQGLLRGPDSMGRNAQYSDYHFKRLEVIKTLKDDYGMGLGEIRRLVTMAGPDEDIQVVPLMAGLSMESPAEQPADELSAPPSGSALDFIRKRQFLSRPPAKLAQEASMMPMMPNVSHKKAHSRMLRLSEPPGTGRVSAPLEQLLEQFKNLSTGNPKRKTRGEDWIRLQITPDIEFHIRGHLSPEQLACFEQLADIMRHTLLGENGDE